MKVGISYQVLASQQCDSGLYKICSISYPICRKDLLKDDLIWSPFLQLPNELPKTCLFLQVLEIHRPVYKNGGPSYKKFQDWCPVPNTIDDQKVRSACIPWLYHTVPSVRLFTLIVLLHNCSKVLAFSFV